MLASTSINLHMQRFPLRALAKEKTCCETSLFVRGDRGTEGLNQPDGDQMQVIAPEGNQMQVSQALVPSVFPSIP